MPSPITDNTMVLRAPASCAGHASNPPDLNGPCHLLCGASPSYPPGRELKGSQPPRLAFISLMSRRNNITLNFRASAPDARPPKTGIPFRGTAAFNLNG